MFSTKRVRDLYRDEGILQVLKSGKEYFVSRYIWPIIYRNPKILSYYLLIARRILPRRFTDADPTKKIYIDPNKINKESNEKTPLKRGRIYGGEWDENTSPFIDRPIPNSIKSHYVDGKSWKSTDYPKVFQTLMEESGSWGYESKDKFEQRCEEIDTLYKVIEEEGYLSQEEILSNKDPSRQSNILNEITVDIGRDGEFIWRNSGQHRLTIAKIQNIDRVPVLVSVRHKKWQQLRNEILNSERDNLSKKAKNHMKHPDLKDII
jgi:ribosomal protein S18